MQVSQSLLADARAQNQETVLGVTIETAMRSPGQFELRLTRRFGDDLAMHNLCHFLVEFVPKYLPMMIEDEPMIH